MPKVWKITGLCLAIYASLLIALSLIWYQEIFKGYFTFFDDSKEWLQMDKAGHFFASFQVSRWFIQILRWQNVDKEAAQRIGVWGGIIYVSPIEILDGYSHAYGFSYTDLLANACGSLFLWGQLRWWRQLHYLPKFSFVSSPFAPLRKEMLGGTFFSQLIKDYNGQTYWLSVSPNVLLGRKVFPEWLLVSIGYGADNLLGGHDNSWEKEGQVIDFSHLTRSRQLYLSLDISLQSYDFKHPALRWARLFFSCIKFPFPAVGLDANKGITFKWLGF